MLWGVYPIHVVPRNRKKRLEATRNKREIYEFVDSASPERIGRLRETIRPLRKIGEKENP